MEEDEPKGSSVDTTEKKYVFTIYTAKEKYVLMVVLALVGFWSTVSSPIYFPALPAISSYFNITEAITNLSVVAYLVFQGVIPSFSSNFADVFGRRPVIIVSMIIYIAACVALSQANTYWLIAVLRCIQAAGIGPVIAISSGVSGDICTIEDRGGFVGTMSGLQLTGNAFGGLMGAALINRFGWRGIFIFLAIGCGAALILVVFCLPETIRSIVGNGTILPKSYANIAPIFLLKRFRKRLTNDTATLKPKRSLDFLSTFKILFQIETICVLLPGGIMFATWTMALTSLNLLEGDGYHYTVLKVGYIYLPQGVICFFGSMVTGRTMNWYYRKRKDAFDLKYKGVDPAERPKFSALKARVHVCIFPIILSTLGLIIYGWCLEYKQNISSIIISTCLISFASSSVISICTTIMVDLHPNHASVSASLMNLVRCLIAALCTGVLSNMTASLGVGGCYTLWAGIGLLSDLLLIYLVKNY